MSSPHVHLHKVLEILREIDGVEKYLDIGCGDCTLTSKMARAVNAKQVHVVDLDEFCIEHARYEGTEAERVDINTQSLPYPDNYFDFITAIEVIEHLYNPNNLVEETQRCLKRGAHTLVATPNLTSWINRILVLFGYLPFHYEVSTRHDLEKRPFQRKPNSYGHIRLFTAKTLCRLLEVNGFEVVRISGESLPYTERLRITGLIDRILSVRPTLASDLIILAKKV